MSGVSVDQSVPGSVHVSHAAAGAVAGGVFSQLQYTQPRAGAFHPLQLSPPPSLNSGLAPATASSPCVPAQRKPCREQ